MSFLQFEWFDDWRLGNFFADDVLCSEQCDTAPYCQCEV